MFFDPTDDKPLNEDDYALIDSVLERYGGEYSMVSVSELDGFLTAVVSGPRALMTNEWMPQIWGGEDLDPVWESTEEFTGFLSRITRLMNQISDVLMENPDDFEALYLFRENDGEKIRNYAPWCLGYTKALNINLEDWDELDNEDPTILLPILLLASDLIKGQRKERTEERTVFLNSVIDKCAVEIHQFWLKRRKAPRGTSISLSDLPFVSKGGPEKRETRKIGMNEPCPCGSGRKYKKCCLN